MTRPLAPHGTHHCYWRGCRCDLCRRAYSRYAKRRRVALARGETSQAASDAAITHLRELIDAGNSRAHLAAVTGCSRETISHLASGRRTVIRAATARRILAIPNALPATYNPVDATGTIRRVRALLAAGHKSRDIAAGAGVEDSVVSDIVNGHVARVRGTTAARIAETFERLSMRTGPSVRNIRRAMREGWAPPLAWDEDIDDPEATPQGVPRARRAAA